MVKIFIEDEEGALTDLSVSSAALKVVTPETAIAVSLILIADGKVHSKLDSLRLDWNDTQPEWGLGKAGWTYAVAEQVALGDSQPLVDKRQWYEWLHECWSPCEPPVGLEKWTAFAR